MGLTKEELTQKVQEASQVAGHAVEQVAKTVAREDVQQAAQEIMKVVQAAEDKKSVYSSKTFLVALAVFVLPLVAPQVAVFKAANPLVWDALISLLFGTGLRAVTSQPASLLKAPAPVNYLSKFFAK